MGMIDAFIVLHKRHEGEWVRQEAPSVAMIARTPSVYPERVTIIETSKCLWSILTQKCRDKKLQRLIGIDAVCSGLSFSRILYNTNWMSAIVHTSILMLIYSECIPPLPFDLCQPVNRVSRQYRRTQIGASDAGASALSVRQTAVQTPKE